MDSTNCSETPLSLNNPSKKSRHAGADGLVKMIAMPEDSEQNHVYAVYRSPCRYCGMPITFEKTYGGKFPSHLDTDGKIKGDGRCPKFNHQDVDGETAVGDQRTSYPSRKKGRTTSRSKKSYTPRRSTWNDSNAGNEGPGSSPNTIDEDLDTDDRAAARAQPDSSSLVQDAKRAIPACYHADVGNDKVHVYQVHPDCVPPLHAYQLLIRGDPDKSIAPVVARFAQWWFGRLWIASNGLIVSDTAVAATELVDLATTLATTQLCPLDSIRGIPYIFGMVGIQFNQGYIRGEGMDLSKKISKQFSKSPEYENLQKILQEMIYLNNMCNDEKRLRIRKEAIKILLEEGLDSPTFKSLYKSIKGQWKQEEEEEEKAEAARKTKEERLAKAARIAEQKQYQTRDGIKGRRYDLFESHLIPVDDEQFFTAFIGYILQMSPFTETTWEGYMYGPKRTVFVSTYLNEKGPRKKIASDESKKLGWYSTFELSGNSNCNFRMGYEYMASGVRLFAETVDGGFPGSINQVFNQGFQILLNRFGTDALGPAKPGSSSTSNNSQRTCPYCGKTGLSPRATACPNCGEPL